MSPLSKFIRLEALLLTLILILLYILGFFPPLSFDHVFLQKTGLIPYMDFRPGYPPIGYFPYYYLYLAFFSSGLYITCMFIFNGFILFLLNFSLYVCLSKINRERALSISVVISLMPSVIYFTLVYTHADALAMAFLIFSLYFMDNPWLCGILCGLGALTKIYPAILLFPLFVYYTNFKKRVTLIYSFILTTFLFSLPFLLSDPLMYASVALSHGLRGPSESIFALIDGYFGHTGFLHPTFDATFYSWQFAMLYEPNSYDHFRYQWNIPVLPYISLALQFTSLFGIGWMARKSQKEAIKLLSLAIFFYFSFSTFYNPLIHIPQIFLLAIATANWNKRKQLLTLAAFEAVNSMHSLVWFSPTFLFVGTMLPLSIAVILRAVLYVFIFLNLVGREGV